MVSTTPAIKESCLYQLAYTYKKKKIQSLGVKCTKLSLIFYFLLNKYIQYIHNFITYARRFILFLTEIRLQIKDDFFFLSLKIRLDKRMLRGRELIECLHLADRIKYFSGMFTIQGYYV
jgi:hypothetical protein